MKILKSHLEEKIGKKKNISKLAEQLTMLGLEVDSVDSLKKDYCIDIDLTPNRGDCFSVLGVAREIAADDCIKLKKEKSLKVNLSGKPITNVTIKAYDACPKYCYSEISNLSLKDKNDNVKKLPEFINYRLEIAGINSINPIVDILNYVMLDIGQPMHAFDKNKIDGDIQVRFAKSNEKIILLDKQKINTSQDCLLISDEKKPIALAGVMGSYDSSVDLETNSIILESAFFSPRSIRGKGRRFGIQTDASQRYERGVDFELQRKALLFAISLIHEHIGGVYSDIKEISSSKSLPTRKLINLSISTLNNKLGTSLSITEVKKILTFLEISSSSGPGDPLVKLKPPSHRFDLEIEADIIEEVARLVGYDKLPLEKVKTSFQEFSKTDYQNTLDLKKFIASQNFQEVINYSFVDDRLQEKLGLTKGMIKIQNPINEKLNSMRTSLLPGLLNNLTSNSKRGASYLKIFEEGKVFSKIKKISELNRFAGIIYDQEKKKGWRESGSYNFFSQKEFILKLLNFSNLQKISLKPSSSKLLHPKVSADIFKAGKKIGSFGEIHPIILKKANLKKSFFYFELDSLELFNEKKVELIEPSKYPQVQRDLAFTVPEHLIFKDIESEIIKNSGNNLINVKLFDLFKGGDLPKNHKSLAFRITWQSKKETLDDLYIESIVKEIAKNLKDNFKVELRG